MGRLAEQGVTQSEVATTEIRLYKGDYFTSARPIADLLQSMHQVGVVSSSLLYNPVVSMGFRRPLLASFVIQNDYSVGTDQFMQTSGTGTTPLGDCFYDSKGTSFQPHKLRTASSLRQFTLEARAKFRDPKLGDKAIYLPPYGGSFTAELVFFKDIEK